MRSLSILVLLASLAPAPLVAQAGEPATRKAPKVRFDAEKVVTVTGTVLGEREHDRKDGTRSVRLVLKVGEDQVSVHLGPDSWMDRQKVVFAAGDEVVVRGSKFTYGDRYGIIAQSVTCQGESLALRDAAGKPVWASTARK